MEVRDSLEVITNNYKDYGEYVAVTRAFPSLVDGCKSIYRRTIHQTFKECGADHNYKSAEMIGAIVKLHPHPTSIYEALVELTQNDGPFPLYEGQGNFGSSIPKSDPSAERYTALKMSQVCKDIFEPFGKYVDMIEGEMDTLEPEYLATLIPLCFLEGSQGISVGLGVVNIPPLNPLDLVNYYIEALKNYESGELPNLLVKPNIGNSIIDTSKAEWKSILNKGEGKYVIAPNIQVLNEKTLRISGMHKSKTIKHVREILNPEIEKDQIDVRDETTTELSIVVEILPYKKVNIYELEKRLYKKLSYSDNVHFTFSYKGAVLANFPIAVKYNLDYTIKCCRRYLKEELYNLQYKMSILQVIEKMKKDDSLPKLAKMNREQSIAFIENTYKVSEDIAKAVLARPISYLTKEHLEEINTLKDEIILFEKREKDVNSYLIEKYENLKKSMQRFVDKRKMTRFAKESDKYSIKGAINI